MRLPQDPSLLCLSQASRCRVICERLHCVSSAIASRRTQCIGAWRRRPDWSGLWLGRRSAAEAPTQRCRQCEPQHGQEPFHRRSGTRFATPRIRRSIAALAPATKPMPIVWRTRSVGIARMESDSRIAVLTGLFSIQEKKESTGNLSHAVLDAILKSIPLRVRPASLSAFATWAVRGEAHRTYYRPSLLAASPSPALSLAGRCIDTQQGSLWQMSSPPPVPQRPPRRHKANPACG